MHGDRAPVRIKGAFLLGCLAGSLLCSMFYVWWSGILGSGLLYPPLGTPFHLHRFISQQKTRVWTLESELGSKKRLLVAILTSRALLDQTLVSVNETWATWDQPGVAYCVFVAGHGPAMPHVHWMRQMNDFQPGQGNLEQTFHVLAHLYSDEVYRYHWFLLAAHNTYVAVRDLDWLLSKLDPATPVYMGRAASEDKNKMAKLHLLPEEYYCEWGPGIILSSNALLSLSDHLVQCQRLGKNFGRPSKRTLRADVELGRCLSRTVGVQCTSAYEAQSYFINDHNGHSISPERLWYNQDFHKLMTLYPIRDRDHMRAVHQYVLVREMRRLKQTLTVMEDHTEKTCKKVLPEFAAPLTEPDSRSCSFQGLNRCESDTSFTSEASLPRPFKEADKSEVTPWMHMDQIGLYESAAISPVVRVNGELKEEINYVVQKSIFKLNIHQASELSFKKLNSCYFRYRGMEGREYLLDMILVDKHMREMRKRLRVLRPHLPEMIVTDDAKQRDYDKRVNIIVPLSHVSNRLEDFFHLYEKQVLVPRENVTLYLVVLDEEVSAVNKAIAPLLQRYTDASVTVIPFEGQFARAKALNLGMEQLGGEDLAFLCDVDMMFDRHFLDQCRLNTKLGRQVYYPECFKYYNLDYVYHFKKRPSVVSIKREHGHWGSYSYGMVCIYRSDYDHCGGFDSNITGWGGEDVQLFESVLASGIEIFRTPEPTLSHRYHEKTCSFSLGPKQFAMCISSRNEGLADRMQLAEYVYYLEGQCGIKDWSLWT